MYEIRKHKTEIREYYIEKRRAIEDGIKAEKDAKVSSNVIASATYRYADTLLLYMPKADEIDIRPIATAAFEAGKKVAFPRCNPEYRSMVFHYVSSLDELEESTYGLLEPKDDAPAFDKSECEKKNVMLEHLYHKPLLVPEEILETLKEYREMVKPFVCNTSLYLWNALKEGKTVLLEGQLGTLKDPDHGIYPMVTSSSTLAAYGAIGAGLPPYEITKIVTVCKAYSSAVGAGAFVSEIFGEEADELRKRGGDGGEFGATTGRPRRMGWFDCVASKYGCRMQGATDVAFTVLDVLGYLDEIPVCTGYEIDGEVTTDFPTTAQLEKAKPVLEKLPGWKSDIRGIRKYEDLPENCKKYIEFVEEHIGFPITMVSNGPGRDDIIYRESKLSK